MLVKVNGPECPQCGSTDSEVISTATRRLMRGGVLVKTETLERRECRFCDRRYFAEAGPAVSADLVVAAIACPRCGGSATRVTSTRGTLRWHSCDSCGAPFRSIERAGH